MTQPLPLPERMALIQRLRSEGRTDAANELEAMQGMLNKLIPVMDAAVALVCAPGWAGMSDEDCELEAVLRRTGFVTPNASVQRQTREAGLSAATLCSTSPDLPTKGD